LYYATDTILEDTDNYLKVIATTEIMVSAVPSYKKLIKYSKILTNYLNVLTTT
jgi:hypothetical protein